MNYQSMKYQLYETINETRLSIWLFTPKTYTEDVIQFSY